ncbi:MAG: F0F1 ATP synthase subunit A [bacterium]
MEIEEISFSAPKLFEIAGFPITNTFLMTLLVGGFVLVLFSYGLRKKSMLPGSLQNFLELILENILNFIDNITGDRKNTEEIFPLAATLFIVILFSNLLELVPGLGVFHFLRSPSSDLNFTLGLSLSSMTAVHFFAVRKLGIVSYLKKYVSKNPIMSFVGALEAIGEVTKAFSLAVRLFGNLFAGEVLLLVTSFLFSYFLPIPFLFLEVMVGFIQAMIFSSLIVIFYVTAIQASH